MPDKCISGQMTVDSLLQLFKPSFYLVGVDGTDGMDCIEGVGGTRRIYLMLVFCLQNRFRVGWSTLRS